MRQAANQAQPRHRPARMSVSQWTPRATLVMATATAMPAAAPPSTERVHRPAALAEDKGEGREAGGGGGGVPRWERRPREAGESKYVGPGAVDRLFDHVHDEILTAHGRRQEKLDVQAAAPQNLDAGHDDGDRDQDRGPTELGQGPKHTGGSSRGVIGGPARHASVVVGETPVRLHHAEDHSEDDEAHDRHDGCGAGRRSRAGGPARRAPRRGRGGPRPCPRHRTPNARVTRAPASSPAPRVTRITVIISPLLATLLYYQRFHVWPGGKQ